MAALRQPQNLRLLDLPNEIIISILRRVYDGPWIDDIRELNTLWQCRQIPALRWFVEQVFAEKYLAWTYIHYELGWHDIEFNGEMVETHLQLAFEFERWEDPQHKRAVFRDLYTYDEKKIWPPHVVNFMVDHWMDVMEKSNDKLPPHFIQVARLANNTPIPGLTINYPDREISFDWVAMLDLLFEEENVMKLWEINETTASDLRQEQRDRLDSLRVTPNVHPRYTYQPERWPTNREDMLRRVNAYLGRFDKRELELDPHNADFDEAKRNFDKIFKYIDGQRGMQRPARLKYIDQIYWYNPPIQTCDDYIATCIAIWQRHRSMSGRQKA